MVLNEVKDLSQVSRSREPLVEFTGGREGGREGGRGERRCSRTRRKHSVEGGREGGRKGACLPYYYCFYSWSLLVRKRTKHALLQPV